jgi:probable HAF family extracellular repeat protein
MRRANLLALLTLAFWLSVLSVVHAASYNFTTVDVPGAFETRILGINDRGDIVGGYRDHLGGHGFLFDGEKLTTIDFPESQGTEARGINNKGQIVGFFGGQDLRSHGFLYDHQQFTVIDAPFPDAGDTVPGGINDRGQIVGRSLMFNAPPGLENERGFLFEDQEFQVIPIARPSGINNRGEIVGDNVVLFANGVLTQVLFPGALGTTVLGINDSGVIVGNYQVGGDITHGYVYLNGVFSTLDVPFPNVTDTFPVGINNKGEIVGVYFESDVSAHGFVATPTKE